MTPPRTARIIAAISAPLILAGVASLVVGHAYGGPDLGSALTWIPTLGALALLPGLVLAAWAAIDWVSNILAERSLDRIERHLVEHEAEDPVTARDITRSMKRYLREL